MPIIFNANDSCIFNLTFDALFYINNYSQPLQFIAHYNSASVLWNTSVQAYLPIVANMSRTKPKFYGLIILCHAPPNGII